jgi:HK97 family phage portal protein
MGWRDWFSGLLPAESKSTITPGSAGWYDMLLGRTASKSGQPISVQTALECTAWLCGTRVIAEGLAQVPCKVIREVGGARTEAADHPLYKLLHRKPNQWQTSFEFREQLAIHLVLCGNAFVVVTRDTRGGVLELLPYEPGAVTVTRNNDMTISYSVQLVSGASLAIPAANMWHIRGPSWNGWMGLNAVNLARNALGLALAAEEFGSELFLNGARPSGILTTEGGTMLSPAQMAELQTAWVAANTGTGQRMKTAVLSGVKWQSLSSTPDEAQFIELRKQQVVEVARALRINPIMLMHQDGTAAYASVEQMFLAHATHTLGPWFERFEQSAEVNLLTEKEWDAGYRIELIDAGLVRGTAKERAETFAILRQNGVISQNEWRDEEDYTRVNDTAFDKPAASANLYGPPAGSEPAPAAKAEPMALTVNVAPQPLTVNTPAVSFKADAPVVNVSPPDVTVNTPEIKVEAPHIDVHLHKGGRQVKSIEYDSAGNIARITEDDAE